MSKQRTSALPVLPGDRTLEFRARGYAFGTHGFDTVGTDVFTTRLLGRRVTFARGSGWVRFFYEGDRFTRDRAMPRSVKHSLQDEGSVQTLVGPEHRHRKALFVGMLDAPARTDLDRRIAEAWQQEWAAASGNRVSLLELAGRSLTAGVCAWADIPLSDRDLDRRATEFAAMIDGAGSFGPRNVRGRTLRLRTEAWARQVLRDSPAGTIPGKVAGHRDADGRLLDERVAAVELLNLLRPTVAIARFIVFAALALHLHPEWRARVAEDEGSRFAFAQEVRRTTPFFPVVGGTAARDLEWEGVRFTRGDWVIIDLFATNRDPRLWADPLTFAPDRFRTGEPHRNALVPQGGGFYEDGHRCPGEPVTVDLLASAAGRLAAAEYTVPGQDFRVDLRRFPAQPEDRFVLVPG
ncbi:MAG: cytochrome P450 [Solirubrobacterales bacterium]